MVGQVGRGLLWAEGEGHKRYVVRLLRQPPGLYAGHRQRKALSPAFSNSAIRKITSVFYDSAYKVGPPVCYYSSVIDSVLQTKVVWDNLLGYSTDGVLIDVQKWFVVLEHPV